MEWALSRQTQRLTIRKLKKQNAFFYGTDDSIRWFPGASSAAPSSDRIKRNLGVLFLPSFLRTSIRKNGRRKGEKVRDNDLQIQLQNVIVYYATLPKHPKPSLTLAITSHSAQSAPIAVLDKDASQGCVQSLAYWPCRYQRYVFSTL